MNRNAVKRVIREKAAFFGCADAYDEQKTASLCDRVCAGENLNQMKLTAALREASAFSNAFTYRTYWTDYLANSEGLAAFAALHTLAGSASPFGALYLEQVNSHALTAKNAVREAAKGEWQYASTESRWKNGIEMPLTDISAEDFRLSGFNSGTCLFQKIMKHVAERIYDAYDYPAIIAGCGYWDEQRGVRCVIRSDLFRDENGMYLLFRLVCHAGDREERQFQAWFASQGRHFRRVSRLTPLIKKPLHLHRAVHPRGVEAQSMAESRFDPIAKNNAIPEKWVQLQREKRFSYEDIDDFKPDSFLSGGSLYQRKWLDTAAFSPSPVDFRATDFFIISHYIDFDTEERQTDYELDCETIAFSDASHTWVFFRFRREHPDDGEYYVCQLWRKRGSGGFVKL